MAEEDSEEELVFSVTYYANFARSDEKDSSDGAANLTILEPFLFALKDLGLKN